MTDEYLVDESIATLEDWIAKHAPKPWHQTPDGRTVTQSGASVLDELIAAHNVITALRAERAAQQSVREAELVDRRVLEQWGEKLDQITERVATHQVMLDRMRKALTLIAEPPYPDQHECVNLAREALGMPGFVGIEELEEGRQ